MTDSDRPRRTRSAFATIDEAIADIKRGQMVIVVDDEDRENEGDITMAAEHCTAEHVAFMRRHCSGVICVPMSPERIDALDLPQMVQQNSARLGTAFTVSVDASEGVSTGISAADRARTIQILADPRSRPSDLVRPGHVFPLRAREGGVLVRAGQTEAGVDFCRLAGLQPVAVICEITRPDGSMARLPELRRFARTQRLRIVTVKDLIAYRMQRERLVERMAIAKLPTRFGDFTVHGYRTTIGGEHLALVLGDVSGDDPVLVRVHDECLTGEAFHSLRCDCGEQLEEALKRIAGEGRGVLLYLRQEGRGIGLMNKLRAYSLQDQGLDTVEANEKLGFKPDQREYGIGVQMLLDLGLRRVRVLTNNPNKLRDIGARSFTPAGPHSVSLYGLEIVERIPLEIPGRPENARYLRTKKDKLGHLLSVVK
jgi:3,4-dihydroxy 2-butanone 4-phosphate synthase/GTP cyclohydrolase II